MPSKRHAVVVLNAPALRGPLEVDAHLPGREPPERIAVEAGGNEVNQEALPVPFFGLAV